MAQEFTMPKLGLTMTDGTIREWLVAPGTMVNRGDPVLVIETDKVETEVEAREPGILQPTGLVGENYECGAVIGYLLAEGETAAAPAAAAGPVRAAAPSAAAPAAAATDVATPSAAATAGATAASATTGVASVGVDVAARGEGGRILASPRARAAARDLDVELAQIAGTGPLGRIIADDVAAFAEARNAAVVAPVSPPTPTPPPTVAAAASAVSSPASGEPMVSATGGARVLAELLGIDLVRVSPARPGARITREDVATWVRIQIGADTRDDRRTEAIAPTVSGPLLQTPTKVVPFRGMRGVIAQRMYASLQQMAQLTLSVDADMTAINLERDRQRTDGETPPGYTAWVVAAAARALAEHPVINSQITADGVALLPDINVGVAVALDDGLIVPVIEHTNRLSVGETHGRVADLAGRARNGKLKLNELDGGTFSVTALGMYGVDMFTPVINPPNTAILGVGRLRTDTVWVEGRPEPRTVMSLSLTWDHRAFDGAPAAEFAQTIVRCLENPGLIIG